MYCPSCGNNITQKLNYCNSCGTVPIYSSNSDSAELDGLIWSVLLVGLITLGFYGLLLYFRLEFGNEDIGVSGIGALMLVKFLGGLVVDWIILRQLFRFIGISHQPTDDSKLKPDATIVKQPQTKIRLGNALHITQQPTRFLETPIEPKIPSKEAENS